MHFLGMGDEVQQVLLRDEARRHFALPARRGTTGGVARGACCGVANGGGLPALCTLARPY